MLRCLTLLCIVTLGCAQRPAASWGSGGRPICASKECYETGALGPEWQVVRKQGAAIGFFNSGVGGVIQSNATCRDDADVVPLQSLTDHLLIGYTERSVRSAGLVPLGRREALRTVVDAKLDGVPLVLDLYVLKRNGCVFDLSFAAPPPGYEIGAAAFQRFVGGFRQLQRPERS